MPNAFSAAALAAVGTAAAAALASGCGGSGDGLVRAAEPARSPPLERPAAGRVITVGNKPEGLALDPRTRLLAVGLTNPDRLALVDVDRPRVVRRLRLPEAPRHLRLAAPGGPVLVPSEKSDELVQVSLPGGRITTTTEVGRQPHDADADARGRIFAGDEGGDTLSLVEDGRLVRQVAAPVQPGGVVTTTDRRRVAVVGVSERALELYDT
ncbi:MAG: YncE family protein, partial [Thermoleophilaceae bacterium]